MRSLSKLCVSFYLVAEKWEKIEISLDQPEEGSSAKKNSPQEDITTMENVSTRMYVCIRMCLCVRENAVTFFLKYSKYDESDTRSCSNKKLLSIMENLHFADSTDAIIFVPIEYVSN